MTDVRRSRQPDGDKDAETRKSTAKKADGSGRQAQNSSPAGPGKLVQVRLRVDELRALDEVMRTPHIESTSEALREGLRLLVREAAEVGAAEQIRTFYQGRLAPVPEGVAPASDAELAATDETQW